MKNIALRNCFLGRENRCGDAEGASTKNVPYISWNSTILLSVALGLNRTNVVISADVLDQRDLIVLCFRLLFNFPGDSLVRRV